MESLEAETDGEEGFTPSFFPRRQWLRWGIGVAAVAGLAALYWFDPAQVHFFPPCPLQALTGLYCPGCGSTRAIHQLLHGNLYRAFRLNPLMILSLPFLGFLAARPRWDWARKVWVPWAILAVLVGYGVLRNVNVWPFVLLAPREF